MDPAAAPVLVDVDRGVAVITLNRPDRLNVFSAGMGRALGEAYARCDEDDTIRAVVVTGAGRAFCAGADMAPDAASFAAAPRRFSASPVDPPAWEVRKPVIAAVNGHAIGIGLTLALQCDIRIAAQDAKLAIPQVRRGVIGDCASHWTLPRLTSMAVAADLLLTGRTVLGEEAAALGLVSRALPAAQVLEDALSTALDIAVNCSPLSVALSKRLLWDDAGRGGADRRETERRETAYHRVLMGRPDAAEGPRAWVEGRPPVWASSVTGDWPSVIASEGGPDRPG